VTTVHAARSFDEVEALRPVWESLEGGRLPSDIDLFLTFLEHSTRVLRPHVVLVEDGAAKALVVARLEDFPLAAQLGYGIGYTPTVRALTVVYGGFLGDVEAVGTGAVLDALAESLRGERLDLLRLRMLTVDSGLHSEASSRAPALRLRRFAPRTTHWAARIPGSMDEFLAARSRERRKNVRRHARRLEESYGDGLKIRFFARPADLDGLYEACVRVHRTSYQHALGVGFSSDERQRRLTELSMRKGWYLAGVLFLCGEPVAFQLGTAYRGTYAASGTAFDPAHSEERPGTYLLMKMIERLCEDPAVNRLDFGFGDADYKRAFADESWTEQDVEVFGRRPRPLGINLVQTSIRGASAAARSALARTGHLGDVRRSWRSRLAAGDREE
jgi:Acetyltransferase (GNAT) domain